MRSIRTVIAMFVLLAVSATAQIKTTEETTTVDGNGSATTTYSTSIKTEEDITPRTNMIVVNPLKLFLFYNLSYFHALSNNIAVGGGLQVPTLDGLSGFGLNAEMRFHPSGKALRGFYIAPNISYNNMSGDNSNSESVSVFSIGGLLGWQWFPGDDFAMGLGLGVDYYDLSTSADDETTDDVFNSFDGLSPALRFDIGYAW